MKNTLIVIAIAFALYGYLDKNPDIFESSHQTSAANNQQILSAFENRQSDRQVGGFGEVVHILPDDTRGSQHQKFILSVAPNQTILVAHNIDLAPRIANLRKGDTVEFYGEYEWNPKGGVLHWTHHDPGGRHENGWLRHNGLTYQ